MGMCSFGACCKATSLFMRMQAGQPHRISGICRYAMSQLMQCCACCEASHLLQGVLAPAGQGMLSSGHGSSRPSLQLQDLNAAIAPELFPQLASAPRDDWDAHPGPGRVADEVAEFYFMQRRASLEPEILSWNRMHEHRVKHLMQACTDHGMLRYISMCRDDARVMSQLYWQYTRPIRSMLMGLTPEDEAVRTHCRCPSCHPTQP